MNITKIFILILSLTSLMACKKETITEEPPAPEPTIGYAPQNLYVGISGFNGMEFRWDSYNIQSPANYFEVEYGLSGFTLGSGTKISTNFEYTNEIPMEGGNAYQFYVRGYYDELSGFGDWAGPYTYFASQDWHMCTPPSNVQYTIESNVFGPFGAAFTWDKNGEHEFEITVVSNNASPNNANYSTWGLNGIPVYTLTQNTEYDMYIRAVCLDGSKTNWVGPKNVNIGG